MEDLCSAVELSISTDNDEQSCYTVIPVEFSIIKSQKRHRNIRPLYDHAKTKPPLLVRLSHNRALVPTSTHLSVCPAVDSNQAELVLRRRGAPEAIYFTRCTYAHTYAQILEGNVNILHNYNLFQL